MIPFDKPAFSYNYQIQSQLDALDIYRAQEPGRDIPQKNDNRILIATWNIANLGLQERKNKDYQIIAHMINWFDLIAIQEVSDNLSGLNSLMEYLSIHYRCLFSDYGGNKERAAYVYDSNKITLLEKVGEVAVPPSDHRYIKLSGITQKFKGFDRNPYLAAFRVGDFTFLMVNVHLYFGSDSAISKNRRSLETYAVGRWADLRRKSENCFTKDIIALGDFNLPKAEPGDPIYEALIKRGLQIPDHSTQIGSSIANDNHYDQIAFFPGETANEFTGEIGIFDFDGALFRTLWDQGSVENFNAYMRYYISDHRLLWAEFRTQ